MPQAVLNLRRIEFLAGLPMNAAEELASIAELRRFPNGARIYTQGDHISGVYVVVKGGLKVFRTDGRGRVQVLQFLKVGECVGQVPVFDGAPSPSSADALGPSLSRFAGEGYSPPLRTIEPLAREAGERGTRVPKRSEGAWEGEGRAQMLCIEAPLFPHIATRMGDIRAQ